MPNYYNPYNFYPATYQNAYSGSVYPQMQQPQQSYAQGNQPEAMKWVEGEVGAKAFQMPQGWPANQPIPLWDSTDTVIWLKSWGPMGIPNPMQRLKYEMPEQQPAMSNLMSGDSGHDSQQVIKQDLENLKNEMRELKDAFLSKRNQNGNNNGQMNKGGGQ